MLVHVQRLLAVLKAGRAGSVGGVAVVLLEPQVPADLIERKTKADTDRRVWRRCFFQMLFLRTTAAGLEVRRRWR